MVLRVCDDLSHPPCQATKEYFQLITIHMIFLRFHLNFSFSSKTVTHCLLANKDVYPQVQTVSYFLKVVENVINTVMGHSIL